MPLAAVAQTPATGQPTNVVTTTIRPSGGVASISAAGNVDVITQTSVVFQVNGTVASVNVQAGDKVNAGDVLATLDTTDLARAERQAELNLASSQAALQKLTNPDPRDVQAAQAQLASAQQNLYKVLAGPTASQLAAAKANLASAQDAYTKLLAGQTQDQLTQLAAAVADAQEALQQAQSAYDKVANLGDAGSTTQAQALQSATVAYQNAVAAYNQATQPPDAATVQADLNAVKSAQYQLENLQPTEADIAAARAAVSSAQTALNKLTAPSQVDVQTAQIAVQQAELNLQLAKTNRDDAQLRVPIAGTILTVGVVVGQQVSTGFQAVTVADVSQLQLAVNLAEIDVTRIQLAESVEISIDALPGRTYHGTIIRIAPSSTSVQGVVNYPVTIQLTDKDLSNVRPGMTAVANMVDIHASAGWLVPTNSIQQQQGKTVVLVIRGGQPTPVAVTPGEQQGEWTVVQSPDLHAGDAVVGSVSVNQQQQQRRGGGFGGPFGPGGR
jgi:HlyD family secretion protein